MNFEELESLWAAQRPANVHENKFAELKRLVRPELNRRRRFLCYEMFTYLFALVVIPLLAVANSNYSRPQNVPLFWVSLALNLAWCGTWLVFVVRRIGRHRTLLKQGTTSLQAFTAMSVSSVEAEMQECRIALWPTVLGVGLVVLTGYVNSSMGYGWKIFALHTGLILGILLPLGLVSWRHYRVNLKPDHARLQEILKQLS
ncbi:MAG: hypothetical protein ABI273_00080 [Lacunisphaera sp.]